MTSAKIVKKPTFYMKEKMFSHKFKLFTSFICKKRYFLTNSEYLLDELEILCKICHQTLLHSGQTRICQKATVAMDPIIMGIRSTYQWQHMATKTFPILTFGIRIFGTVTVGTIRNKIILIRVENILQLM
jgi:hypothetical protein